MFKKFKKRILTSITLLILLFLMLINNFILGYFLIIFGIFAILEFFNLTQLIFKRNILKHPLNFIFLVYIFSFCGIFLVFSSFFHLKILLFLILITCVASDIGGFLFGNYFKGPKLSRISPNKTISGAIGSLILSCLVLTSLTYLLTEKFNIYILYIALFTSIACQFGDLIFSYLKRKSLLKDTGNLLPGHGGVLDRIDGLLIGVPIGFLTLLLVY